VFAAALVYIWSKDPFHASFPRSFLAWVAWPIVAAALSATAWRGRRARARVAGLAAVVASAAFAASTINAYYAYFPDLRSLTGKVAAHKVSRARVAQVVHAAKATGELPSNGLTFSLMIPSPRARFHARSTFVYLPPAWFASPRPMLPVLMLISGSPGTPADWTRSARADELADRFAHAHGGVAPVLVMPDANGGPFNDTECVDGPRGAADTYLSSDVRDFVVAHYGTGASANDWAIAGLSEGGTCALTLALRHPDKFASFGDFGGDVAPTVGKNTLKVIFGGSRSLQNAYTPLSLLHHRRLTGAAGWFEVGVDDRGPRAAVQRLAPSLAASGVETCTVERAGRHNFDFWHATLEHALPWFAARLGIVTYDPANVCAYAGGHGSRSRAPGPRPTRSGPASTT
jgi:S-formylglutathione hydrolase FrmB